MRQHVDYDQVASTYDERFVSDTPEGVGHALLDMAQALSPERVLEVGCGTCHWLAQMCPVAQELYGLDLSAGMLRQARSRETQLELVRGYAGQLPFGPSAIDLVFCVNAIHHFEEPQEFVSEALRVLRPGGVLVIVGGDPHGRRDSWYVYDYFDGTYEADLERFPGWRTTLGWMAESGFERAEAKEVERILDIKRGREVLADPFLRKNSSSQLAILTDAAYAAGLERIELALAQAEAEGKTTVFQVDLLLAMLIGYKATSY